MIKNELDFFPSPVAVPVGEVTKAVPWPSDIAQKWDTLIQTHAAKLQVFNSGPET